METSNIVVIAGMKMTENQVLSMNPNLIKAANLIEGWVRRNYPGVIAAEPANPQSSSKKESKFENAIRDAADESIAAQSATESGSKAKKTRGPSKKKVQRLKELEDIDDEDLGF